MKRIDMNPNVPLVYDLLISLLYKSGLPSRVYTIQYWKNHPRYTIVPMNEHHYKELTQRFHYKYQRKNKSIAWSYYRRSAALLKIDHRKGKDLTSDYYYIENRIMPPWRSEYE